MNFRTTWIFLNIFRTDEILTETTATKTVLNSEANKQCLPLTAFNESVKKIITTTTNPN